MLRWLENRSRDKQRAACDAFVQTFISMHGDEMIKQLRSMYPGMSDVVARKRVELFAEHNFWLVMRHTG